MDLLIIKSIILVIVLLVATITDLTKNKVYNWLTFPAIILGLALNLFENGMLGCWQSASGLVIGGIVFLPLFLLKGMGAGDIKLMSVIGSFMGVIFVINSAIYIAILGGVIAIVMLIIKGKLLDMLKNISNICLSSFMPKFSVHKSVNKETIPYAVVISLGTVLKYFLPNII